MEALRSALVERLVPRDIWSFGPTLWHADFDDASRPVDHRLQPSGRIFPRRLGGGRIEPSTVLDVERRVSVRSYRGVGLSDSTYC
jgi:hypothetical protein